MKRTILIAVIAGFFGSVAGHYVVRVIDGSSDSGKPASDAQMALIRT